MNMLCTAERAVRVSFMSITTDIFRSEHPCAMALTLTPAAPNAWKNKDATPTTWLIPSPTWKCYRRWCIPFSETHRHSDNQTLDTQIHTHTHTRAFTTEHAKVAQLIHTAAKTEQFGKTEHSRISCR